MYKELDLTPSFMPHDRRKVSRPWPVLTLSLILGVLFILAYAADHAGLTNVAHADQIQDDHYICTHLDKYTNGSDEEVLAYCAGV